MARKWLTNLDMNGNTILNPVMNPLAAAPANAMPYYCYVSTAAADKGIMYVNVGTYAAPVWQALGRAPTAGDGIVVDGYEISLPEAFYDYLVEQTFETPTISALAITGLGGAAEIGTSVSVSAFTHTETNIANISGTLTLKHGSTTIASNIAPSASSATGSFTTRTVTRTSAGSETFTLSGTDALGRTVSRSVSKSFYVPRIYGTLTSDTATAAQLLAMTHAQSYGSPQSVTLSAAGYIYLASQSAISTVKNYDTGFGVAMTSLGTQTLSINGVNVTYNVYRTDQLQAQTIRLTIS